MGVADRDILLDQQPYATPDCVANLELGASSPLGPVWRSRGLEARAGCLELTPWGWLALHPWANVGSRWAWAGASMSGERSPLELEPPGSVAAMDIPGPETWWVDTQWVYLLRPCL